MDLKRLGVIGSDISDSTMLGYTQNSSGRSS